MHTVAVRAFYK